jgi:hypothetical protein
VRIALIDEMMLIILIISLIMEENKTCT